MALNDPWELDVTSPVSNSNFAGVNVAEGMAPSLVNNGMRQLASWLAQVTSYQSAALSSSVSTNIAATGTGLLIPITGANAISSFGSVAGTRSNAAVLRILEFSSSASLSHSSGALSLIGGASRRTQPGDIGAYIHTGSAAGWKELFYSRADGALSADSISVTTITNRSLSTSAISTVTLNAASASVTAISITALNSLNSVSASVGAFTLARIAGAGVHGPLIHIRDEKASGTDGGSSTGAAWTKHTLDDVKTNEVSGASVASSVLALPVGTYFMSGWSVFFGADGSKLRWRNTSDAATAVVGGNGYENNGGDFTQSSPHIAGRFTVSSSAKNFELQYYVEAAQATTGLGRAVTSGEVEVYADVQIWKLA